MIGRAQVCFCAGLQMALLHAPWDPSDEAFFDKEEYSHNGRPIFRGPRLSMAVCCLPPGSCSWELPDARRPSQDSSCSASSSKHHQVGTASIRPLPSSLAIALLSA